MGKGAQGSGLRERLVPMLGDSRSLLTWWVQEVKGEVRDDWIQSRAILLPSERGGTIGGETFAIALRDVATCHLRGPVTKLSPHVHGLSYPTAIEYCRQVSGDLAPAEG